MNNLGIIGKVLRWMEVPAFVVDGHDDRLVNRITRYRAIGFHQDGIHVLRGHQIDETDYALMGAENSSAKVNHPGEEVTTGRWFVINPKSELARRSFGNCHSSMVGGEWITETFYTEVAMPQFWPSPEEVVWHHLRVTELRKQGVEQADRIRMMTEERASRPWGSEA